MNESLLTWPSSFSVVSLCGLSFSFTLSQLNFFVLRSCVDFLNKSLSYSREIVLLMVLDCCFVLFQIRPAKTEKVRSVIPITKFWSFNLISFLNSGFWFRKSNNDFRTAMFERKKSPNRLVVDEAIKRIWVCVSSFRFLFFVTAVSISFHIWHRRMALFWFKLVNEVDRCIETSLEIEMRNCVIW